MKVTPLIPDVYHRSIKHLSCSICLHIFYVTLADYEQLSPISYCHECSVILHTELHTIQPPEVREVALPSPSKIQPTPPPRVPQPRTIDREKLTPAQLVEEGNAHIKGWQYSKALASFNQALEKSATSAAAHCGRGTALYELKRYEEALASYDEAIRLDPTYAAAHAGKGVVLQHFKRRDEALAAYDQALQLNSSLFHTYLDKYRVLVNLKCDQEAEVLLRETLTRCNQHLLRSPESDAYYRSEEHTSELQSHLNLVCRLLLEKKKKQHN